MGCWIFGFASQYSSNAQPTRVNLGLASLAVDHRGGHRCPGGWPGGTGNGGMGTRTHTHLFLQVNIGRGSACLSPMQRLPEAGWFASCVVRPLPRNKQLSHPLRTRSLWHLRSERHKAGLSSCGARSVRNGHRAKAAHFIAPQDAFVHLLNTAPKPN